MARVIYAYPVSEIVGSVGGVTFQRNASGTIARAKPNIVLNPSPGQATQQYNISRLVALWPTLTQSEKDTWTTNLVPHAHVTPWGQSKYLNGYQWFMSCNLNLILAGEDVIPTAPAWSVVSPPAAFTFIATVDLLYGNWGVNKTIDPDWLFIYLTLPLRQSSLKLRRSLYYVDHRNILDNPYCFVHKQFAALCNVVWADFFNSAKANIIMRLSIMQHLTGLMSPFTSGIVQVS